MMFSVPPFTDYIETDDQSILICLPSIHIGGRGATDSRYHMTCNPPRCLEIGGIDNRRTLLTAPPGLPEMGGISFPATNRRLSL